MYTFYHNYNKNSIHQPNIFSHFIIVEIEERENKKVEFKKERKKI